MKILALIYDGFAEFELTFFSYLARGEKAQVVTVAPKEMPAVTGLGGLKVLPELPLDQVDVGDYSALVIPGGIPDAIIDRDEVSSLIRRFHDADKWIGAVCAGPVHLARAGVLDGKSYTTSLTKNYRGYFDWSRRKEEPLVMDGRIMTALDTAFVDFSITFLEIIRAFGSMTNPARLRREFGVRP